jgi:hypothetical protein
MKVPITTQSTAGAGIMCARRADMQGSGILLASLIQIKTCTGAMPMVELGTRVMPDTTLMTRFMKRLFKSASALSQALW